MILADDRRTYADNDLREWGPDQHRPIPLRHDAAGVSDCLNGAGRDIYHERAVGNRL